MPGVRIVEEPTDDLWFAPDQCVIPDASSLAAAAQGFMGLGDFYDPFPHMSLGALGARRRKPAGPPFEPGPSVHQVMTSPEFEFPGVTPEEEQRAVEDELERQMREEWSWRARLPAMFRHAPREIVEEIQDKIMFVSTNFKTGYSFNIRIQKYRGLAGSDITGRVPPPGEPPLPEREQTLLTPYTHRTHEDIPGTCVPTAWCTEHCYAKVGHYVSWDRQHWYNLSVQQARYLQNLIVSHMYEHAGDDEIDEQASIFYEDVKKKFTDGQRLGKFPMEAPLNLRLNGGGDFNAGSIRLFNRVAENYPDMLLWGFTRKKDTADMLVPRHNVRIQVSLDPSTPTARRTGPYSCEELVKAAYKLHGHMSYATGTIGDENIAVLRGAIAAAYGDKVRVNTVFGYHCGALHTEIGDPMECSATNPRCYAACQVCRWCMMNDQERMSTPRPDGIGGVGVVTPNQSFFAHGGEPHFERIEKENAARTKHGIEPVEPVTEEEAFSI